MMARQRSSRNAGGGPPALRPVEESALREAVAVLAALDLTGLRLQWRNVFGGSAPAHLPKLLLARILAYRVQGDALGDLPDALLRTLAGFGPRESAGGLQTGRVGSPWTTQPQRRIKPGSILVREWDGRLHRVMALEEGFVWDGKTYRSLSKVAGAITGGHWNGPRFFGLTGSRAMARVTATIGSIEQAGMSGVDKDREVVP
jgi:Protein of unknown function (DUF2924)